MEENTTSASRTRTLGRVGFVRSTQQGGKGDACTDQHGHEDLVETAVPSSGGHNDMATLNTDSGDTGDRQKGGQGKPRERERARETVKN